MRRLVLAAAAAALALSGTAASAGEATLQGRIVTPDERTAIKHLPVIVRGRDGTVVATTDEDGRFEVPSLPPGRYQVAPANEPGLAQEVVIERSRRVWELWKPDVGKPVTMDDIHLPTGRRY